MADLNKRLLRTMDGPAPQQKTKGKSDLEYVEGSDGAQHVKVVSKTGNVQDIGDRLEAIEQRQSEILERLDKPIDTQVTGSNVEFKKILADKVIPSGSYVTLKNADDSHMRFMTQNVNIGVRWDSSIDWKVRILYVGEETTATIEETEVLSEHNNKNRAITSFKPKNPKALVRLHNDDEDDQNVINVTISQFL